LNSQNLITGSAGFIGFHLSNLLLHKSYQVIGIDNLNDYYDPKLKEARLAILEQNNNFIFHKVDTLRIKQKLIKYLKHINQNM
jgi:UDP-glucuronate 4-epimerase